jgi:hypothetical protein
MRILVIASDDRWIIALRIRIIVSDAWMWIA